MNFQNISTFNEALLAKQIRRCWTKPDSMVAQILKHKYFPTTSTLDARLGSNASYVWRSIWGAKPIILSGLIWNDHWTLTKLDSVAPLDRDDWVVDCLIDAQNKTWNRPLVASMFSTADQERILEIPISDQLPKDRRVWAWTKSGHYSVKSRYWIGRNRSFGPTHSSGLCCGN